MTAKDQTTSNCPYCDATLLTDGSEMGDPVRCAGCQNVLSLGYDAISSQSRTSVSAIISLILGLSSVVLGFLSGPLAVVFGMLALRAIRRTDSTLHGRGFAIGGIASGTVFSLACGCVVASMVWAILSFKSTTNSVEIEEMCARVCTFDLPPKVKPMQAQDLPNGMMMFFYGDQTPVRKSRIMIQFTYYPSWLGFNHKRARAQIASMDRLIRGDEIESTQTHVIEIHGPFRLNHENG